MSAARNEAAVNNMKQQEDENDSLDEQRDAIAIVPLLHLDVTPETVETTSWASEQEDDANQWHLLAASVKLWFLKEQQRVLSPTLHTWWLDYDANDPSTTDAASPSSTTSTLLSSSKLLYHQGTLYHSKPPHQTRDATFWLPQNNVLGPTHCPCHCRGYVKAADVDAWLVSTQHRKQHPHRIRVYVTPATSVHVQNDKLSLDWWGTDADNRVHNEIMDKEVLDNHHPNTVRELLQRFTRQWQCTVDVSSTAQALSYDAQSQQRKNLWRQKQYKRRKSATTQNSVDHSETSAPMPMQSISTPISNSLAETPSLLLVHSPHSAVGKTCLVTAIVRQLLEPTAVLHVIPCVTLMARFGVAADAVLESTLHAMVYRAALTERPVCIVLDGLDSLLSPTVVGKQDAAVPVLHALTALLRVWTDHMARHGQVPFPAKNPMHNGYCGSGDSSNHVGYILPVRVLLVGILTCPDDGGRALSATVSGGRTTSLWDYFRSADRYRLPVLTVVTRLHALQAALQRHQVQLTVDAAQALPRVAANAVWMQGAAFGQVARQCLAQIQQRQGSSSTDECSLPDLMQAMTYVSPAGKSGPSLLTNVSFEATTDNSATTLATTSSENNSNRLLDETIGGNTAAKVALLEALSLDPSRRALLARFGVSPPTGVLLYGAPGTGKTLLARAVARVLPKTIIPSSSAESNNNLDAGGAFVALQSRDLLQSTVGSGEKLLVEAFEVARRHAPAVVFLDEFQSLFMDRRSGSGSSSQLTSTLLSLMDDLRRWDKADQAAAAAKSDGSDKDTADDTLIIASPQQRIVVLAATNTPWMVDKAFLRPGRFDRVVHVGLPTTMERRAILQLQIQRMKTNIVSDRLVSFCEELAQRTEGYTGADLAVVCRTAAVQCLLGASNDTNSDDDARVVTEQHFLAALEHVKPSSDPALVERISRWDSQAL